MPGPVRSRARGDDHRRRGDAGDLHDLAGRCRRRDRARWRRRPAAAPAHRPRRAPATSRGPRPACSAGSASSTRRSLEDYRAHGGYAAPVASARDRCRGGRRRGDRVQAHGSRRRRLPDRSQVGGGGGPAGPAALPRLQRRRVGAGHVQGSRAARRRSVRDRRGDDDRRVRHRLQPRATCTSAASIPRPRRIVLGAIEAARAAGLLGAGHPRLGVRLRHRAPARRRRLHLRRGDGALRVDRGQARRAAQQAAVPGRGRAVRQADRGQQRRDAGQRAADRPRGRRGVRRDRHGGLDRPEALLPVRPRRATGRLRGRVRGDPARPHRARRRRSRSAEPSGPSCSAARPASSSDPTRWTCRSPSRRRGRPGRRSARA